eukprot:8139639-Alexandrium_andersonii.AAC.1
MQGGDLLGAASAILEAAKAGRLAAQPGVATAQTPATQGGFSLDEDLFGTSVPSDGLGTLGSSGPPPAASAPPPAPKPAASSAPRSWRVEEQPWGRAA